MADIPLGVRQEGAVYAAAGAENLAVRSAEQQRYAQAQARRREVAGKGARDSLSDWADEVAVHSRINEFFGDKIRPAKTKAEGMEHSIREMSKVKTENMSNVQRTELRSAAFSALGQIPEYKPYVDWLNSLVVAGNTGFRDSILDDALIKLDANGNIGRALRAAHKDFFANPRVQSQELTTAQAEAEAKKQLLQGNVDSIKANATAAADNKSRLDDFDPSKRTILGTKAYEQAQAQKKFDDFFDDIAKKPAASGLTAVELKDLFQRRGSLNDEINAVSQAVAEAGRKKLGTLGNLSDELNRLRRGQSVIAAYSVGYEAVSQPLAEINNEQNRLEGQRNNLATESATLTGEKAELEREAQAAQGKVDRLRVKDEKRYLSEIQNLTVDALKNLYEQNLAFATEEDLKVVDELIKKETDPVIRGMLTSINEGRWRAIDRVKLARFKKGEFLGGGKIETFKDGQIILDTRVFIDQGQDAFNERLVREQLSLPAAGALTPDQQEQVNKVLESPRFKTDVVPRAAKELFAAALKTGNLSDEDKAKLLDTDYGQGVINNAEARQQELVDEIKKRFNFVGPTKEFFKKNPKLGWGILLTLIFGAPGAVFVGGYAGYKMVKGGGHAAAAA